MMRTILIVVVIAGCGRHLPPEEGMACSDPNSVKVEIAELDTRSVLTTDLHLQGVVEADPDIVVYAVDVGIATDENFVFAYPATVEQRTWSVDLKHEELQPPPTTDLTVHVKAQAETNCDVPVSSNEITIRIGPAPPKM